MKRITQICLSCKNNFEAQLREVKRGNGKFCTISCASKFNRIKESLENNRPNVFCSFCKCEFYRNNSKKKNSRSGLYFCCKEHKDLAQKIGGIKEIQPSHYGTSKSDYRELAFEHLSKKCNKCQYSKYENVLVVHHKDRNRKNNNIDNLEILCPTCHLEEHFLAKDGLYNKLSKNIVEFVGNDPT